MNRLIAFWFLTTTVYCGTMLHENGMAQDEKTISLNFPGNRELNLEVFVDFVQKNLEIPLAYDPSVFQGDSSTLTIKPNGLNRVSKVELYHLLNNTLRIRGLAIVKDSRIDDPYYTIKPIQELRPLVPYGRSTDFKRGDIFTEVFSIANEQTSDARKYIESFYPSENRGRSPVFVTELTDRNELIVTGFKRDMLFVEDIVRRFNGQSEAVVRSFYVAQNTDLQELNTLLNSLLGDVGKINKKASSAKTNLRVLPQESRNRLLLIGSSQQVARATKILGEMDTPNPMVIESYAPREISAVRLDELFRSLLTASNLKLRYRSSKDDSKNRLIVKATPTIHRQLKQLLEDYDQTAIARTESRDSGLVRTYKLKNVKAKDILNTIRSVERKTFGRRFTQPKGARSLNRIPNPAAAELPERLDTNSQSTQDKTFNPSDQKRMDEKPTGQGGVQRETIHNRTDSFGGRGRLIPGQATVESFGNTIIVVAEPQVQSLYAKLIQELDKRPPQVLIEATVVSIDCADDYALGVEISGGDRVGARKILAFSSFGLSRADPVTGALSLIPGVGFNGTLIDPDSADAVLRALANHRKARVVSAPKILVNDNSEGELSSISEVPFTSVNASNTVSTTSFAGFAEAGTSIHVLPNISEGDHVNLDFSVTVNDFSGAGVDGIPPPRQTDDVSSQVTIPDGHTVIVGGLRRKRNSKNESFLPGLEHLSIFKMLGGSHARNSGDELLFIFLKPIILRDDKFKDLRFLSEREIHNASIPSDFPRSHPLLIR